MKGIHSNRHWETKNSSYFREFDLSVNFSLGVMCHFSRHDLLQTFYIEIGLGIVKINYLIFKMRYGRQHN